MPAPPGADKETTMSTTHPSGDQWVTGMNALAGCQYLRSDASEVIHAIRANMSARREFYSRAEAWCAEQMTPGDALIEGPEPDFESIYRTSPGTVLLWGIKSKARPIGGRWKEVATNVWAPWKNNPVRAQYAALKHSFDATPGLPRDFLYDGPNFMTVLVSPRPFEHNGAAYVDLGRPIDPELVGIDHMPDPSIWREIKASEYHTAREAHNDTAGKATP